MSSKTGTTTCAESEATVPSGRPRVVFRPAPPPQTSAWSKGPPLTISDEDFPSLPSLSRPVIPCLPTPVSAVPTPTSASTPARVPAAPAAPTTASQPPAPRTSTPTQQDGTQHVVAIIAEMQARLEKRLDKIEASFDQTNTRLTALEQKATRRKHEDLSTDSESEDQMDTDERRRRRRRRSQNYGHTVGHSLGGNAQEGSRTQGPKDPSTTETANTETITAMMETILARLDPISQELDALQCRVDGLATQSDLNDK